MLAVTQRLTPRSYLHQPLKSPAFIYFQSTLISYIVFFALKIIFSQIKGNGQYG